MKSIQEFAAYWELRKLLAQVYSSPHRARDVFDRAGAGDAGDVVFEGVGVNQIWDGVLKAAWSAGRLGALLEHVLNDRGVAVAHADVRRLRARLPIDQSTAGFDAAGAKQLEAFVGPNRLFLDVAKWRQELAARERQVCRVVCGGSIGSGFLVGPDVVLTCFHVLAPRLQERLDVPATFTFDYKREGAGVSEGLTVPIAPADAVVDQSPSDELDFALVRLESAVGSLPIDDGASEPTPRGFWTLPKGRRPPRPGLACLQHPRGAPLKLAIDPAGVPRPDGDARYVRYDLPTQPGSSGAPVFDHDYRVIALHRFGAEGEFNAGVAIEAIADRHAFAAYAR